MRSHSDTKFFLCVEAIVQIAANFEEQGHIVTTKTDGTEITKREAMDIVSLYIVIIGEHPCGVVLEIESTIVVNLS